MSDHYRAGDLDRSTAERLLDGADGHAPLHALLSAAAAPARPEELAGEDAAVAAFKAAPRPAPTSHMAALRRFLTVKALVLVGGSLILSGGAAAYAAMNGHLPGSAPARSPTPTLDEKTSTGRHSHPVAPATPSTASPSGAPSPTKSPSKSDSPTATKGPGGKTAPGLQQKTQAPGNTQPPPRGPGANNGTPPSNRPGNENGSENGNPNSGTPPGQNSGNGNGIGKPD